MHPLYKKSDGWTKKVIGAAIEVHREIGPGLLESIYERCLLRELECCKIPFRAQVPVPVVYKGETMEGPMRLDILVDDCLILEIKAVDQILPIHKAQLLTYMKLMRLPVGLLINFNEIMLMQGLQRMLLKGAADL